jgi:hypothetical protein
MATLATLMATCATVRCLGADTPTERQDLLKAKPEAVEAWKDMRFGMFICWGPVSLTGKEIGWSRGNPTPVAEYDSLYRKWNPEKFGAREWVKVAKGTGARYIVFLLKHHDGFCLWDTKQTDYNIMNGPFRRDVTKELAAACREQGIGLFPYYSTCDWHHPDFPVTSPGGKVKRPVSNLDRYKGALGDKIAGTFKGDAARLLELMRDAAAGKYFFPAVSSVRFKKDMIIDTLPKPIGGVAVYDIDGDGYPDVLVSKEGGGLRLYRNPGAGGGKFIDATSAAGLDKPECGAGLTGFVAVGDFDGDGRTDIFYAAGRGLILVQSGKGVFSLVAHRLTFDLKIIDEPRQGLTGGGCFAPVWRTDSSDIVCAGDGKLLIVSNQDGNPVDRSEVGNETHVCGGSQLATLAEDLNMDGTVDLLTFMRQNGVPSLFHSNRGYGSFMADRLYAGQDVFAGDAFNTAAGGAAAGDVDGDGANDLLVGGLDGKLRLVLSDALASRTPKENPTSQERKLEQTAIVSVRVTGKTGVLGAVASLVDEKGVVVGQRVIGSQIFTGCRGPDTVNLAVREPGKYTLRVRFSDGAAGSWPVAVAKAVHLAIEAPRKDAAGP